MASNSTNITSSTATILEPTTHFLEHRGNKDIRRDIYDNVQIIQGALIISFNLFLLILCLISRIKQTSLHRRMSFMMLVLIIFSLVHGVIFSIGYTLQRQNRYDMTESECIASTLIIDFCDLFVMVLLPGIAFERFISIFFPQMRPMKQRIIMVSALIFFIVATALAAWLPMVPAFEAALRNLYFTEHREYQRTHLSRFYIAYSCNEGLNKNNWIAAYIFLAVQLFCILLATIFFILATVTFSRRTKKMASLDKNVKKTLSSMNVSIAIVCLVITVTHLPFPMLEVIRNHCEDLNETPGDTNACSAWGVELRFSLRILFHLANLLGPLTIVLVERGVRRGMGELLCCCRRQKAGVGNLEEYTMELDMKESTVSVQSYKKN